MSKRLLSLASLALLFGCAQQPNDRAQQYQQQTFPHILNRADVVESNKPRDYTEFSKQSELVVQGSASMAKIYRPLYEQLNEWVLQSGDPATLAQFGIQAAQLGGGDKQGNVLFTGYFSPVIELRHQPDSVFKYPVYGLPKCNKKLPHSSGDLPRCAGWSRFRIGLCGELDRSFHHGSAGQWLCSFWG